LTADVIETLSLLLMGYVIVGKLFSLSEFLHLCLFVCVCFFFSICKMAEQYELTIDNWKRFCFAGVLVYI